MIEPNIVRQVRRLLAGRIPHREIARRLKGKIGRTTVGKIASGARPDYQYRPVMPEPRPSTAGQPKIRCLGCGGLVEMPCRTCAVRHYLREAGRLLGRPADTGDGGLVLDLRPADRARYLDRNGPAAARRHGPAPEEIPAPELPARTADPFNQDVWDDPQFTQERLETMLAETAP